MRTILALLPLGALALALGSAAARADEPAPAPAPAKEAAGAFEPGRPSWADLRSKAIASGRAVLIDFSTEWCGWCKKLDAEVFPRPEVAEALAKFVCAHLDAEKDEGQTLAVRYGVRGFPTLVVVDAEGAEIDRIIGYRAPKAFVEEVGRIARGEGTLPALRKAAEEHPDDVAAAVALARREMLADRSAGVKRLEEVLAKSHGKDAAAEAEALLALGAAAVEARQSAVAEERFGTLLREFGGTAAAGRVGAEMGGLLFLLPPARAFPLLDLARQAAKEPKDVVAAEQLAHVWHQAEAARALRGWAGAVGEDAQALNEVAWTAFLQKMTPKEALGWAQDAVRLSERDPAILDTLANLLEFAGKVDEALALETEALERCADPAMKAEFAVNIAKWRAGQEARKKAASEGPPSPPAAPATPPGPGVDPAPVR